MAANENQIMYIEMFDFFSEEDTNNETQCTNVKKGMLLSKRRDNDAKLLPRTRANATLTMNVTQPVFTVYASQAIFFHMSRQRLIDDKIIDTDESMFTESSVMIRPTT